MLFTTDSKKSLKIYHPVVLSCVSDTSDDSTNEKDNDVTDSMKLPKEGKDDDDMWKFYMET